MPPWLGLLLTALLAAGLGLWFGGTRAYFVPSESMEPTLLKGDEFRADILLSRQQNPRRGEIWVVNNPEPGDTGEPVLVKRVVGLPGETVEISHGKVLIDGHPLREPYCREPAKDDEPQEKLGPYEYWLLGDNRNNSDDSRDWGPLGRGQFIGRAFLRTAPLDRLGPL